MAMTRAILVACAVAGAAAFNPLVGSFGRVSLRKGAVAQTSAGRRAAAVSW